MSGIDACNWNSALPPPHLRWQKNVIVRRINDGAEYAQPYDKLILSPGAAPFVPTMDGTDAKGVFTLRNLADLDRIRAAVDQAPTAERKAVVSGFRMRRRITGGAASLTRTFSVLR